MRIEILEECNDLFRINLFNKLYGKIFHITNTHGYENILNSGYIYHSNHETITNLWEYNSYFKNENCISVCDFYHNKDKKLLDDACGKYDIYSPGCIVNDKIGYYLILKERIYDKCIIWKSLDKNNILGKQIVPNLESGIKDKIPLEDIDYVIKVVATKQTTKSELENLYLSLLKEQK